MKPIKQSVPINFAGALDLKTDPWQVSPANFLSLNNSVFTTGGRLTKRNGFPQLGTTAINPTTPITLSYSNLGPNITKARKVFSYQNELCLNDDFNLYSFDKSANAWSYKGRSTMVSLSTQNISQDRETKTQSNESIDSVTGIKVYAWLEPDSFAVRYSIQDIVTGQIILNNQVFGINYQTPICLSIAGKSWIFAVNTIDGKIYYQAIVGQTVTGPLTVLVSDLNAVDQFYDIDVVSGNIYLTYFTSAPAIKIAQLNSSLAIVNSITKAESATNGVSLFGDGSNIWVVYNNGAATKAFIVNNAVTATVLAPTVVDAGPKATNVVNVTGTWSNTQNLAFIFYDTTDAVINYNTLTVGGVAGTATEFIRLSFIVSKAFSVSGIAHIVSISPDTIQATYFLLNLYNKTILMGITPFGDVTANIAAKIAPNEAGEVNPNGFMKTVHNVSGSVWELALGQKTQLSAQTPEAPLYFGAVGVIDCQFDFSLSNPDVIDLAKNAHIASGELIMYDGASVVEQNFHIYPQQIQGTNGGLGSLSAGTYGYIATYEWEDNQGQLHRSFTSQVKSIVAAAGTRNDLTIVTLRVTNKSNVVIKIYRTKANGSVYFLVNTGTTQIANDPSIDFVTYSDGVSDVSIEGNLQLYTTGELADYAVPATQSLSVFKNRLLSVDYETGYIFNYSKQVLVGYPVEFVPEFLVNIGTIAGPMTAVAGMDDKIIIFKSGLSVGPSILYMVGIGPAASGANNDFTDPLPVAVDCGCVDRRSIVLTPNGLMFKSAKGIYLLDRNLQVSYIGAPVEGYNQFSVVSSQLIPNTTQVRFLLSNGTLLMYDYFYGRWATFSNPAGISDCIFEGKHTYVDSSGIVYQETPGVYYDGANTPILMSFQTSWIKLAGLQGYQRSFFFYLLAEFLSAHQLSISTYTNFSSTPDQTDIITPISTDFLENWRVFLKKQRCQSFQISLSEVYTGTLGPGFTMSGLNLIIGAKSSFRTIPAAQSVG